MACRATNVRVGSSDSVDRAFSFVLIYIFGSEGMAPDVSPQKVLGVDHIDAADTCLCQRQRHGSAKRTAANDND
jgi:hypothetical protein